MGGQEKFWLKTQNYNEIVVAFDIQISSFGDIVKESFIFVGQF